MNRIKLFLCFVIFLQALSSWGQNGVFVDGKEWLQPLDFKNYTYDQVSAVCPGGVCSGLLPRSTFDLTGYTWASTDDVNALFNSYGVDPPFTGPNQIRENQMLAEFFNDFEYISDLHTLIVSGMVRTAAVTDGKILETIALAGSEGNGAIIANASQYSVGSGGVWFWQQVEVETMLLRLEEPIDEAVHSGIGNLRGWAVSEDRVDRVEIYIDGKYMYDAPYGGERTDVAEVYPDVEGSDQSGFSLAFGYSNLGVGQHTIRARAFNNLGEFMDSSATFEVVAFHKDFINKRDVVDTSQATMTATGDEILLENVVVDEQVYDLRLKWRTAEQGFEITEIR